MKKDCGVPLLSKTSILPGFVTHTLTPWLSVAVTVHPAVSAV